MGNGMIKVNEHTFHAKNRQTFTKVIGVMSQI